MVPARVSTAAVVLLKAVVEGKAPIGRVWARQITKSSPLPSYCAYNNRAVPKWLSSLALLLVCQYVLTNLYKGSWRSPTRIGLRSLVQPTVQRPVIED